MLSFHVSRQICTVTLAALVLVAVPAVAPASGPPAGEVRPGRFDVTAAVTRWSGLVATWDGGSGFLGTARGSQGELKHDEGWEVRVAMRIVSRLDLGLGYGRDRATISEWLEPVHVGSVRRYELGRFRWQRVVTDVGSGFTLRHAFPRLSVAARLGLVEAQFTTMAVNHDDPELPWAIGGQLDVAARRAFLLLNPVVVDLHCDLSRHVYLLAGAALDRVEAPLAWSVAGQAPQSRSRDRLAVSAVVWRGGAGCRW